MQYSNELNISGKVSAPVRSLFLALAGTTELSDESLIDTLLYNLVSVLADRESSNKELILAVDAMAY